MDLELSIFSLASPLVAFIIPVWLKDKKSILIYLITSLSLFTTAFFIAGHDKVGYDIVLLLIVLITLYVSTICGVLVKYFMIEYQKDNKTKTSGRAIFYIISALITLLIVTPLVIFNIL